MNTKTTIAVLLIAAALGVYLYVVESGRTGTGDGDMPAPIGEPILAAGRIDAAKVSGVRLDLPDGKSATFTRGDDGRWRQTAPVAFAGDDQALSRLVEQTANLRYTSRFDPATKELTPQQLGLAPPRAVVTLTGAGFEPVVIAVGRAPAAGIAYAVADFKPDQPITRVYVTGDGLHAQFGDKAIDRMRSRTLAAVSEGVAEAATLTGEGRTIALTKRDGDWVLTEPVADRADRQGVVRLVGAFNAARVDEFVADNPSDLSAYGLAEPSHVLTVRVPAPPSAQSADVGATDKPADPPAAPTTHTLAIGTATDLTRQSYYAMADGVPVVFTVAASAVDRLDVSLDDLRDPRLLVAQRADIGALTVRRQTGATVGFVRDQGVWKFADPAPGFALDGGLLRLAFDSIFTARAKRYEPVGDDAPAPLATVELSTIGRTEPIKLAIRDAGEGLVAVTLDGEASARVIERNVIEQLLSPATAYRDRTIIAATLDRVASVRVKRSGKWPAEYTIERTVAKAQGPSPDGDDAASERRDEWKLDGLDRTAALTLLTTVAPMRAERWLDAPLPDDAADLAVIDVKLIDGGAKRVTIDYSGGRGMVEGVDTAFALGEGEAAIFAAELRDPRVLSLPIDDIASINIERVGVTIKRDTEGRYSLDGAGKLDEPKAAAMFNAVASLRAERYVKRRFDAIRTGRLIVTMRDATEHAIEYYGDAENNTFYVTGAVSPFTVGKATWEALAADPRVTGK